ncbi:hypothetical protein [Shewanella nanhaiensis]|uniref:Uncharacterized protein n=1 Tax=Shewanella nanhaiensis TaxID=2864872 RepID=A0ABS7E7F0_9GAMM|nr:hypothetical protein [Shewanella nanhaiensis]MBW8185580.1 hypothetical protein [Shewanella nanhaiensis]
MLLKRLLLLSSFVSFNVFSSGYIHSLGSGGEIEKYQILGNAGLVVWMKDNHPSNPDNCSAKNKVYIKSTMPQYKDMLGLIMSAHAQGKKVGFWSSGCSTNYFWGGSVSFPEIRDVWIAN